MSWGLFPNYFCKQVRLGSEESLKSWKKEKEILRNTKASQAESYDKLSLKQQCQMP